MRCPGLLNHDEFLRELWEHRLQQSDIQAAALWYFIGAFIALIVIAAASGR